MRITLAVPEELIEAANQLMVAIGNPADIATFGPLRYKANNNLYAVASGVMDYDVLTGELTEPDHPVDLALAEQAQEAIGTEILISQMDDAQEALETLGLEAYDESDDQETIH